MATNCVIYVRVSTKKQAKHGLSLEAQEDTCRAFAAAKGWSVAHVVRDSRTAGLPLDKRPQLLAAIGALRKGWVLLAAKRDRLFRADPYTIAMTTYEVREKRKARIVSASGEGTDLDPDDPMGQMISGFFDLFASYERFQIKLRTKKGLGKLRDRGWRLGQLPYGRRLGEDGRTLVEDQAGDEVRKTVRVLRDAGHSYRSIALELTARGYRAHGRAGRVLKRDLELILERRGAGLEVEPSALAAELAQQPRSDPQEGKPPPPPRGKRAPSAAAIARAVELIDSGLADPRQVLAAIAAEDATRPPDPGEVFPESTVRHLLKPLETPDDERDDADAEEEADDEDD